MISHSDAREIIQVINMASMKVQLGTLRDEIKSLKSQMITKEYLDEKIGSLHTDKHA